MTTLSFSVKKKVVFTITGKGDHVLKQSISLNGNKIPKHRPENMNLRNESQGLIIRELQ
jgi:hypothetical protein